MASPMDVVASHDGPTGGPGPCSPSPSSPSPPLSPPRLPGVAGSAFPSASSAFVSVSSSVSASSASLSAPPALVPSVPRGVSASSTPVQVPPSIPPCPLPRPANGLGTAPLATPVSKVGYVLYNERLGGSDTILWSDGALFRLASTPKPFKPFTPLAFTSSFSVDLP